MTTTTTTMTIGLIGLGRMGADIRDRLKQHGHNVTGYDRDPAVSEVASLEALVAGLPAPRVVWVMVPAGDPTEQTVRSLAALLAPGDVIVEGGNSNYGDSIRRGREL